MPDYYAVLGLDFSASAEAIRSAYLAKLKQFHPDIYQGANAETRTQEINEAYACLSEAAKRAEYDAQWRKTYGDERILTEAEVLARLEQEFAGKNYAWQKQTEERLAQIGKDTAAALKAIFIAKKQVEPADYQNLAKQMAAQMQSYQAAKKQSIEDYYTKASNPEFAPQSLLKIQALSKKAMARLSEVFKAEEIKQNKLFEKTFCELNPYYSEEETAKREAENQQKQDLANKQLSKDNLYDNIVIVITIILIISSIIIAVVKS